MTYRHRNNQASTGLSAALKRRQKHLHQNSNEIIAERSIIAKSFLVPLENGLLYYRRARPQSAIIVAALKYKLRACAPSARPAAARGGSFAAAS